MSVPPKDFFGKEKFEVPTQATTSAGEFFGTEGKQQDDGTFEFLVGQAPPPPNFFERVSQDFMKRGQNFGGSLSAYGAKEQTTPETIMQLFGQGAGFVGDVFGEALTSAGRGLSKATPDFIEKPITQGVKDSVYGVLGTSVGRQALDALTLGVEAYDSWKSKNQRAARNLESAVDIASLLPMERLGRVGMEVTERGARSLGGGLVASGEKALAGQRGSFVKDLVSPVRTKAVREAEVGRTVEQGFGPFKTSVVTPTAQEARSAAEVAKIATVKPNNTFQRNYNAIQSANRAEALRLEAALKQKDFIYPKKELLARLRTAKEELARNPSLVGDAEKTAQKLMDELEKRINAAPAKGSELLKIRKEFDQWVENQKGSKVFDPNMENAFSIANRSMRQTVNTFLDEKAPNAAVKESLAKQTSLYNAMDNIAVKAAEEADTAFGRSLQRLGRVLGTKNKIVQGVAAAAGIGGLGAAATFAPAAAVLGTGSYLTYRAGRLVLKPQVRTTLGQAINALDRELGVLGGVVTAGTVSKVKELKDAKKELQDLLNQYD